MKKLIMFAIPALFLAFTIVKIAYSWSIYQGAGSQTAVVRLGLMQTLMRLIMGLTMDFGRCMQELVPTRTRTRRVGTMLMAAAPLLPINIRST